MLGLMPRKAVFLVLTLFAAPALAQAFYRWVDASGTTHYTDNSSTIPQGATVFATEGEPISEMGKPGPVPLAAPRPPVESRRVDNDPAVPTSSEQFWRTQFRAAKEKIRLLEDEIATDRRINEDVNGLPAAVSYSCFPPYLGQIAPTRYGGSIAIGPQGTQANIGPLPQPNYAHHFNTCIQTVNPDYERARQRLEKNRAALERAKEDLHELERRASFEAVPLEWRR